MITSSELNDKLTRLFEENKFEEIVGLIKALPAEMQQAAPVQFRMADCFYEIGDIANALRIYSLLVDGTNERRRTYARYNMALCLRELKKYDEALVQLRILDLSFLKVRSLLGEILFYTARGNRKTYEEAIELLRTWLEQEPADGLSREMLAACLNHLDRHEEALMHFNKCLEDGHSPRSVLRGIIIELSILGRATDLSEFSRAALTLERDADGALARFAAERIAELTI